MELNTEEQYECGNCYFVGDLGIHGGCGRCGSQAVLSLERVGLLIRNDVTVQLALAPPLRFDIFSPKVVEAAGYWLGRCRERGVAG